MAKLTFYKQARADGGVRTGVDIDDHEALHRFEEGSADRNPALVWYVDVRCEGDSVPRDADGARHWLLAHRQIIAGQLEAVADDLAVGVDRDLLPYEGATVSIDGSIVKVVVLGARRVDARALADEVRKLADQWEETLQSLSEFADV